MYMLSVDQSLVPVWIHLYSGNKTQPDKVDRTEPQTFTTTGHFHAATLKSLPNASLTGKTYVVVVVLDGLSCKVEYGPGYDALTDEVADFKVRGKDGLRVFVLLKLYSSIHFDKAILICTATHTGK